MVEDDGSWRSPVAKFLSEDEVGGLISATGPLTGAPAPVDAVQLKELGLRLQ